MNYSKRVELNSGLMEANDLASIMFAFGDSNTPYGDSVAVVQHLTEQFMQTIIHRAQKKATANHIASLVANPVNSKTRANEKIKLKPEHFITALEDQPQKKKRAEELLQLHEAANDFLQPFDFTKQN